MKGKILNILLLNWLIGWTILLIGRIALIVLYIPLSEIAANTQFLPLALWNVVRFDFQTLAYIAILPALTCFIASFLKRKEWVTAFLRYYFTVTYTLLTVLVLADLSFYKNFGEHFNITVFDFFNEEPLTLVQTFWQEYPVVWMLLIIILIAALLWHSSSHIVKPSSPLGGIRGGLYIAFLIVCMRGSVTEFPLQAEDLYVSPSKEFNAWVTNATYSLKKAYSEKKKAFKFCADEELLATYGFKSIDEAWQASGIPGRSLFSTVTDSRATDSLNVVVILSESWSGYLLDMAMHRHDVDLLCGMGTHLADDLLFQNFQSVQNGTIATIENVSIATPFPRLYMSKYRYVQMPTSIALPFNQSGYETTFMSGMDQGWENVGEGLTCQGFKHIQSKYELLNRHPDYKYNSVGIFDHYVMDALFQQLSEHREGKQFILLMTTTNHPPFVYPDDVSLPDVPQAFYDDPAFANDPDVQQKYIRGFQYANQSLARFLTRLKASPLARNTIVVITGDHNVRTALRYGKAKGEVPDSWAHRVPLYIYLPPSLRTTTDTAKWGCHYDIMPTLAPLALKPGTRFLNVGQNLLSDSLTQGNTYSYNTALTLSAQQYHATAVRRSQARELLLHRYFRELLCP